MADKRFVSVQANASEEAKRNKSRLTDQHNRLERHEPAAVGRSSNRNVTKHTSTHISNAHRSRIRTVLRFLFKFKNALLRFLNTEPKSRWKKTRFVLGRDYNLIRTSLGKKQLPFAKISRFASHVVFRTSVLFSVCTSEFTSEIFISFFIILKQ